MSTPGAPDAPRPGAVRFGLAPVNWNNDDVPEWGQTRPYARLAAEAAALGYEGLEAGTGAPEDARELRALLAAHGLRLPGAYVWARLSEPATADGEVARLTLEARRLAAAGADALLVAEHWTPERRAVAGRAGEHPELALPPDRLGCLCRALDELGRRCRETGLRLALHHHVGTPVETPDEVEAVMAGTDPGSVGLCLDTGHTVFGGGDALEAARRHGDRVVYVHAKDVDPAALRDARSGRMGLLDGLRRGVFAPVFGPGGGAVDLPAVAGALRRAGFHGWVIMECDRNPRTGDPSAEARSALPHLRRAFAAPAPPRP